MVKWFTCVMPELRILRQENCPEFEASIRYRVSSRQACDTNVRPYLNNVNSLIN